MSIALRSESQWSLSLPLVTLLFSSSWKHHQFLELIICFSANGDLAKLAPLFPTYKAVVEDLRRGLAFWDSVTRRRKRKKKRKRTGEERREQGREGTEGGRERRRRKKEKKKRRKRKRRGQEKREESRKEEKELKEGEKGREERKKKKNSPPTLLFFFCSSTRWFLSFATRLTFPPKSSSSLRAQTNFSPRNERRWTNKTNSGRKKTTKKEKNFLLLRVFCCCFCYTCSGYNEDGILARQRYG